MKNDSKILIGVGGVILLLGIILILTAPKIEEVKTYSLEESREIAQNWIMNSSPTFLFDGFDLELQQEETVIDGHSYKFFFGFSSRGAGYGDREGEMIAQVITPHLMEVLVEEGEVVIAITDGVFSEIDNKMITEIYDDITIEPEVMMIVGVYFGREGFGEELIEAIRETPKTEAVARVALEELLKGPTEEESAEGFFTLINPGVKIQSLRIEDGKAFVDFSRELDEGVAGSATVLFIRGQIESTLKQFPTVDEVVISVDGRTEDILQP